MSCARYFALPSRQRCIHSARPALLSGSCKPAPASAAGFAAGASSPQAAAMGTRTSAGAQTRARGASLARGRIGAERSREPWDDRATCEQGKDAGRMRPRRGNEEFGRARCTTMTSAAPAGPAGPVRRTLEPEVMDTEDEARDYDAMDHAEVNGRFVGDLLAYRPQVGEVLDVGTGTARIPIELCGRAPGAKVVAIDLADHMLTLARANVARAKLEARIALEK